jgi:hypothetical protein
MYCAHVLERFFVGATKKAIPSALMSSWMERMAKTKVREKDCTTVPLWKVSGVGVVGELEEAVRRDHGVAIESEVNTGEAIVDELVVSGYGGWKVEDKEGDSA